MGLFGSFRTTIVCPKVCQSLGKLQQDSSPLGDMFKIMLKESGLTWNLKETPEDGKSWTTCDLEGSWEAMLKAYIIFTAVQVSEMDIANDINLLYKWCKDCERNVNAIPVNDVDGQKLKYLFQAHPTAGQNVASKAQLDKKRYFDTSHHFC